MCTVVIADKGSIPDWVVDHRTFRQWAHSDEFPEPGGFSFLDGKIWVDWTMEQLIAHNRVKSVVCHVIMGLVDVTQSGRYVADRMLLSHLKARLSSEPDGLYFHWKTVPAGRLKLVEGSEGDYTELEGTPDMVLEVISRSSVQKDTEILPELYWRAGIPEYWLIDARSANPSFEILRHGSEGYEASPTSAHGQYSSAFEKWFRLVAATDPLGNPDYRLEYSDKE